MTQGFSRRVALRVAMAGAAAPALAKSSDLQARLAPYACNLDTWFKAVPFEQRFALARQHGFTVVEFWSVERGDAGRTAQEWKKLLDDNGLTVTQFAPAWPNFADPSKHDELLKVAQKAVADARILGCTKFTVTGHSLVEGMSREAQLVGYQSGLMRMAPLLEAAGITALVEPFNRVNHLNHLLNGSQPAVPMVRAVNSPHIKLLWDFYHMQLEDGDLIEKFTAAIDQVAHVQIGDVPGRHEPGTGEINHANLIRAVRAAGYKDPIGLEFLPLNDDAPAAVKSVLALAP